MRASPLSRLLATCGAALLAALVEADLGKIILDPPDFAPNVSYSVSWFGGTVAFIAEVLIVDTTQPSPQNVVKVILPLPTCAGEGIDGKLDCLRTLSTDFSSTTFKAPVTLAMMDNYVLQVLWAPSSIISSTSDLTTASVLFPASNEPSQSTSSPGDQLPPPIGVSSTAVTSSPLQLFTGSTTPSVTPATGPQAPIATKSSGATPLPVIASSSGGLSTGAKVGIAIGAIGVALIAIIAALLLWRRSRQRQDRALPSRELPYTHDLDSTNRDLNIEKEMNVVSSPVDSRHTGFTGIPAGTQPVTTSQSNSWEGPGEQSAAGIGAGTTGPYPDSQRHSHGSGHDDAAAKMQSQNPPQYQAISQLPPAAAAAAATSPVQRKPVGAASGASGPTTTHHLHEPGMSDEELARLEEEERRLDEAIAEAERRRAL